MKKEKQKIVWINLILTELNIGLKESLLLIELGRVHLEFREWEP